MFGLFGSKKDSEEEAARQAMIDAIKAAEALAAIPESEVTYKKTSDGMQLVYDSKGRLLDIK